MKTITGLMCVSAMLSIVFGHLSPLDSVGLAIQKSLFSPFNKKFEYKPPGYSSLLGKGEEKPLNLPGLQGFSCINQPANIPIPPSKQEYYEISNSQLQPFNFPQNFNIQNAQPISSSNLPSAPTETMQSVPTSSIQQFSNSNQQRLNFPPEYQTSEVNQMFGTPKQMSYSEFLAIKNLANDLPSAAMNAMNSATLTSDFISQMNKVDEGKGSQPLQNSYNPSDESSTKQQNIPQLSFYEAQKKSLLQPSWSKYNLCPQHQAAFESGSRPSQQNFGFQ